LDYFEERWVMHSKPRTIQGSSYKAEVHQSKPKILPSWQIISEAAIDGQAEHSA
jgi:hypothetical protein